MQAGKTIMLSARLSVRAHQRRAVGSTAAGVTDRVGAQSLNPRGFDPTYVALLHYHSKINQFKVRTFK